MYLETMYQSGGRPSLIRMTSRESFSDKSSSPSKKKSGWTKQKFDKIKTFFSKKKWFKKKKNRGYRSFSIDEKD